MYKNRTNLDIVSHALCGDNARTTTGNMSTEARKPHIQWSQLPRPLRRTLGELSYKVKQTIYSYSTPIAVLIDGVWLVPDVKYSATTGSKHQSKLHYLPDLQYIPWDATVEDVQRVVAGFMEYSRATGKYTRGPKWVEGC